MPEGAEYHRERSFQDVSLEEGKAGGASSGIWPGKGERKKMEPKEVAAR